MPRISQLNAADAILNGNEAIPVVQGGATRRSTPDAITSNARIYNRVKTIITFGSGLAGTQDEQASELLISLDGVVAAVNELEGNNEVIGFDMAGNIALFDANDFGALTEDEQAFLDDARDRITFYEGLPNYTENNGTWGAYATTTGVIPGIETYKENTGSTAVSNNAIVSSWTSYGWTGAAWGISSAIYTRADADHGAGSTPGRVEIFVTADNETTPALAMTINSDRSVELENGLDVTGPITQSGETVLDESDRTTSSSDTTAGKVARADHAAMLGAANTFTGNQTVTGSISASNSIRASGAHGDFSQRGPILDIASNISRLTAGSDGGNNRSLMLRASAAGTPNDNQLMLYFNGRVGINKGVPLAQLHVGGDARFDNSVEVTGSLSATTHVKKGVFTVATAPSASSAGAGAQIHVSDGDAGSRCVAESDGTNWKVVAMGATIAAS